MLLHAGSKALGRVVILFMVAELLDSQGFETRSFFRVSVWVAQAVQRSFCFRVRGL